MPAFVVPKKPKHGSAEKAYLILKYAHDTSESMLNTFESIRTARKAHGAPTDEEQDLLRAMLVFAGAGLDAMLKQLIRDALPSVLKRDLRAREELEKFSSKRLLRDGDDEISAGLNIKVLARVLLADSARSVLIELLIEQLTAGSLQSVEELFRILPYFGLDATGVGVSQAELKPVFQCRNLLIHELDIDFDQKNRNRFPRRKEDMKKHTEKLLRVSSQILAAVDGKLARTKLSPD